MTDNRYTAVEIQGFVNDRVNEIIDDAEIEAVQYVIDVYGLTTEQVEDALDGIDPTYEEDDDE